MKPDKFSAVWVSHSSIGNFLECPRAYYIKNMYKNPKTGNKVTLMSPPLALGQSVHEVIESLSVLPRTSRFDQPLHEKLDVAWGKITGRQGGFFSKENEVQYKERALAMLRRVQDHPGPLKNLAVKINMDLPHFWLSEEDGIILCGKIDWLEYLPETDSVHIIDFKTGKREEDSESLQLPIYRLLVQNCQKRETTKASYWYLEWKDELTEKALPSLDKARTQVLKIAKQIKLARQLNKLECKQKTGCAACKPFEKIISGEAEYVGQNEIRQDIFVIPEIGSESEEFEDSFIL